MRELRGKTALVTGAASGIGRAIALRLASEGVRSVPGRHRRAGLEKWSRRVPRTGVEVLGRRCDVAQPREVSAAVADILSHWGGVDILVNNAGITYYGRTERDVGRALGPADAGQPPVAHPVHARAAAVAARAAARPTC